MVIYQPLYFGSDDFWKCEKVCDFSYPAHMHRCIEWIYVISGSVSVTCGSREYTVSSGESVLFMPNVVHSFLSAQKSEWIYLCFSPELVPAFMKQTESLKPQSSHYRTDAVIAPLLISLKDHPKSSKLKVKGLLYLLCADFFEKTVWKKRQKSDTSLLNKLIMYIQEHFTEEITLFTLSKEFGYDYHYLSRYLKNNLHMTFSEYLSAYRVNHACFLLRERNFTITETARLSGYSCIRSFNKAFKAATGMTPSEYRKK